MVSKVAKRVVYGTVLMALVVGLFVWDGWLQLREQIPVVGLPLAVVWVLLTAVGCLELFGLLAEVKIVPLRLAALWGTVTLGTLPIWWQVVDPAGGAPGWVVLLVMAGIAAAAFVEQMARYRTSDAFARLGGTALCVLYLGVGGAMLLQTRVTFGLGGLVLLLVAAKLTDVGAYFVGTACGKHKMIPWLSPGKSWEGLLGGLAVAAGASAGAAWLLPMAGLTTVAPWQAAIFGPAVGLAGQFADLCESLLKRAANAKDSGALVPEFGGVLDMIDSVLLSAPVAFILLAALGADPAV